MAKETAVSRASRKPEVADSAPATNVLRDFLEKKCPLVMGVLNVTPDSFSDGGRFLDPAAAMAQAERLAAEGADILDIGAESSRPYGNAVAVTLDEERARLAPILPAVVALGVPVSIDTLSSAIVIRPFVPPFRQSGVRGMSARRAASRISSESCLSLTARARASAPTIVLIVLSARCHPSPLSPSSLAMPSKLRRRYLVRMSRTSGPA